jgi:hypothetical protein
VTVIIISESGEILMPEGQIVGSWRVEATHH